VRSDLRMDSQVLRAERSVEKSDWPRLQSRETARIEVSFRSTDCSAAEYKEIERTVVGQSRGPAQRKPKCKLQATILLGFAKDPQLIPGISQFCEKQFGIQTEVRNPTRKRGIEPRGFRARRLGNTCLKRVQSSVLEQIQENSRI